MSNEITTSGQNPATMIALAIEKGADVEALSKLMDLQERWEAREARKAYVAALAAFKSSPPTILKNKAASFGQGGTSYEYASLDQVAAFIGAALSRHGLSHSWSMAQGPDLVVTITCKLTHVGGHSESVSMSAPPDDSGRKNPIQQIASTVTYLERYTLLAITGLAASGTDSDAQAVYVQIDDAQAEEIKGLIKQSGTDAARFLRWAGVDFVEALPASRYKQAVDLLHDRLAKKGGSK